MVLVGPENKEEFVVASDEDVATLPFSVQIMKDTIEDAVKKSQHSS